MTDTLQRRAQEQLDMRALEMAAIARADTDKTLTLLTTHIESCSKMQRAQLVGVIMLLLGMLGVLVNLYVLPRTITTTTTIENHSTSPR